jgi:hypothetical protein
VLISSQLQTALTDDRCAQLDENRRSIALERGHEKRRKFNLLYEGFPKLGVHLTVVLVYFAYGVGT